ncbi:Nodulation protein nolO [Minicystis rosea]|nr:Nodulation protein nolO [Minicystis rosea]
MLGISAQYHDAAAALVIDGRVVAAMQEERFSRIKNDPSLPRRAARACLAEAGISAADLDRVVFYENPYAKLERVLVSLLRAFPRSFRQFPRALGAQLGDKLWILDALGETLGVPRERVTFTEHHRCHAAGAFFTSPYERAAILTVDGVGEETSTAIWSGDGDRLKLVDRMLFPHSLGLLYAALTAYLGFEVNEGEYKVMGLAAFGQPRFREELERVVKVGADGSVTLDLDYFAFTTDTEVGFGPRMEALLGPRRDPARPWDLATEGDRRDADVAATLQAVTEDALVALAREARRRTGHDALCLAGGVALNAVANARILRESGFERVFVQPAAGDAGGALGAAILGAMELGDARPPAMRTAALGTSIRDGEAEATAAALGLSCEALSDPPQAIADLLERGKIVAVARGRFEWGPRALGQRSILSLPRPEGVRERLNRAIKKREPFRPFAPAVLADRAAETFAGAPNDMTPFMTTVCRVHEDKRAEVAAAAHVDGTARVQTVTEGDALAPILAELGRRGLPPVVLNTSLNGAREPIAASTTDAIAFFLSHAVDALVVGDALLTRRAV